MDAPSNHKRPAARRAALLIAGLAAALPTSSGGSTRITDGVGS